MDLVSRFILVLALVALFLSHVVSEGSECVLLGGGFFLPSLTLSSIQIYVSLSFFSSPALINFFVEFMGVSAVEQQRPNAFFYFPFKRTYWGPAGQAKPTTPYPILNIIPFHLS